MARVCSRMFLCVYDRERSRCPRPSVVASIIVLPILIDSIASAAAILLALKKHRYIERSLVASATKPERAAARAPVLFWTSILSWICYAHAPAAVLRSL